jgi:two-component system LytT family response regulator
VSDSKRLRVLIADDERLARQRIEDLLAHERNVEIVGQTDNGSSTVETIRELKPDLVFLDIQMPGKTGLEVVREIGAGSMPPVIFTTAYDHAVAAFDLAAIDYLIKPFDDERFEKAFHRARQLIELKQVAKLTDELRSLLSAAHGGSEPRSQYLERIAVEMRGQVRVVPVKHIDYMIASGPYAELFVADKRYLIRERMQTLEERLDPAKFFRIHRSAIVRLDLIETLIRNPGGDYAVLLKGGVKLKVSRGRFEKLEELMGLHI